MSGDDDGADQVEFELLTLEQQLDVLLDKVEMPFEILLECVRSLTTSEQHLSPDTDLLHWIRLVGRFLREELQRRGEHDALWDSYRNTLLRAVLYFRTGATGIENLRYLAQLAMAVYDYPRREVDLWQEYESCCELQRLQFEEQKRQCIAKGEPEPAVQLPVAVQTDRKSFLDSGTVRMCPKLLEAEFRATMEKLPPQVAFLSPFGVVSLSLANPLRLPANPIGGFLCDACNRKQVTVSYQALRVGYDDSRFNLMTYENCQGFDMCVACMALYATESAAELESFFEDVARAPDLACVRVLHRRMLTSLYALNVVAVESSATEVAVKVGAAPHGAMLAAWWLDGSNVAGTLMPQRDWRAAHEVRLVHEAWGSVDTNVILDQCSICLEDLHSSDAALLQTRCHHWFHSVCIREAVVGVGATQPRPCPLCRAENPLGQTANVDDIAATNIYSLRVKKPTDVSRRLLVVGLVISANGLVTHPTDIAAVAVCAVAE